MQYISGKLTTLVILNTAHTCTKSTARYLASHVPARSWLFWPSDECKVPAA